jgi:hypothetical protein
MVKRADPIRTADEHASLLQFLDYQRATIRIKVDGLSQQQLNQTLAPSTMTLGGMLKHLALVEDSWIHERFLGLPTAEPWASAPFETDPDWDWHSAATQEPGYLRDLYAAACERSRMATTNIPLDQRAAEATSGGGWTLRWVLLHLIEETARHADLLREAIDGSVGE